MKRVSTKKKAFLLGLAVGLAGMVALLASMPDTGLPAPVRGARNAADGKPVESFFIDLPGHGIAVTHSGNTALGLFPPGISTLDEERLKGGLAILTKVRNAGGDVIGFAAELEVQPEGNLLKEDIKWSTDWIVVIPGRGTLYLHEIEHSGELGPKVVGPTLASGRPWKGDWTVQSTCGPRPDGRGVILGGTQDFAGAAGSFVEVIRLTGFLPEGALIGTVELRLNREG